MKISSSLLENWCILHCIFDSNNWIHFLQKLFAWSSDFTYNTTCIFFPFPSQTLKRKFMISILSLLCFLHFLLLMIALYWTIYYSEYEFSKLFKFLIVYVDITSSKWLQCHWPICIKFLTNINIFRFVIDFSTYVDIWQIKTYYIVHCRLETSCIFYNFAHLDGLLFHRYVQFSFNFSCIVYCARIFMNSTHYSLRWDVNDM